MPRTARIASGEVIFHVLNRANAHARIFEAADHHACSPLASASSQRWQRITEKRKRSACQGLLLPQLYLDLPQDFGKNAIREAILRQYSIVAGGKDL